MKHLYSNGDGEQIAADTLEEAARYYDCELGGEKEPKLDDWDQIPDDQDVTIFLDGEGSTTKKASEWAAEREVVFQASTTYW